MTDPEIVDQTATTTAVVHGLVPMTEIVGFFDRSFTELAAVLNEQGITPTGPAFARYAGPPGEIADLEVGFPVDQTVSPTGGVRSGSLPAGRVARLVHTGGYEELGTEHAVAILHGIDDYYDDRSGEHGSVLTSVVLALADPAARDPAVTGELPRYKGLDKRWHHWADVVTACQDLSLRLSGAA